MIEKFINKHILEFDNYTVADNEYPYILNANESPYNIFEHIYDEAFDKLKNYKPNRYPDPMSTALRNSLAKYNDVNAENIICGNGSDELISMITSAFIGDGDSVVSHSPTFEMYSLATRLAKGKFIAINDGEDLKIRSDALIDAVNEEKAKLLYLCSPNNPTGYTIPKDQIKGILDNSSCMVIIDEAYGEFGNQTCIDMVEEYENVIVLKTLSKAFGLAGLRVGYAIANENTIRWLYKLKQPYNLNSLSQILGETVLNNISLIEVFIEAIKRNRKLLYKELLSIDQFEVYKSDANFILVKFNKDSNALNDYLLSKGILLKHFSAQHYLKNCFRISIGTPEINNILLETLKEGIIHAK